MGTLKAIATNEYSSCEATINVVELEIVDGYWVNEKGEKITCAYDDETVYFRVVLSPKVYYDKKIAITVYGEMFGPDTIITRQADNDNDQRTEIIKHGDHCDIKVAINGLRGYSAYLQNNNIIRLYSSCCFAKSNKTSPNPKRIELPKDSSDYLTVTHLVGYLRPNKTRVRFRKNPTLGNGKIPFSSLNHDLEVEIFMDNVNAVTRAEWKSASNNYHDATSIGISTGIVHLQMNWAICGFMIVKDRFPEYTPQQYNVDLVNINSSDIDPTRDDSKISIVKEFRAVRERGQRNLVSEQQVGSTRAYYSPKASNKGVSRAGAAKTILVVDTLNTIVEYGIPYLRMKERSYIDEHKDIALNEVLRDFGEAFWGGMIPEKFWNLNDFCDIMNILLYGGDEDRTYDAELYNVAKKVYKDVSKLKKY